MSAKVVTVFAPATVANVAVGFDILGFALQGIGETLTLEKIETPEVIIESISGASSALPKEPEKNTAGKALLQLIKEKNLNFGFRVQIQKSIPTGSGLGGSATSAVAAIVAANSFLKKKLSLSEQLQFALSGEEVASGSRHADNVAPCLLGGLQFVRHGELSSTMRTAKIKTPSDLRCVIMLPDVSINTKDSRKQLSEEVKLKTAVQQTANLAGVLIGLLSNDYSLLQQSLKDVMIEPQRAQNIPGFYKYQTVALESGALGCSISGSGPAIFCLVQGQKKAEKLLLKLKKLARDEGHELQGAWVSAISSKGAHLIKAKKQK